MNPMKRSLKLVHKELDKNPSVEYLQQAERLVKDISYITDDYEIIRKAKYLQNRIQDMINEKKKDLNPHIALQYMFEGLVKGGISEVKGYSIQELFQTINEEL